MATSIDQSDFIKTALRLPRALHQQLLASAQQEGRSLNREILARLETSFELGPYEDAKRAEILALVNAAIDERLQRARPDVPVEISGQRLILKWNADEQKYIAEPPVGT